MSTPVTDARPEAGGPAPASPRGRSTRGSLTGRALILALVVVTLFVALAVPVRTWFAQRAEIAQLRADVAATRERVEELRIEQERWQDPAFVAAEARRRLHFVLPGEIGYVTLGAQASPEEAAALAAASAAPWYATLWGAVQQADRPEAAEDADGTKVPKDAKAPKDAGSANGAVSRPAGAGTAVDE